MADKCIADYIDELKKKRPWRDEDEDDEWERAQESTEEIGPN